VGLYGACYAAMYKFLKKDNFLLKKWKIINQRYIICDKGGGQKYENFYWFS
jgi:hypothetical protein